MARRSAIPFGWCTAAGTSKLKVAIPAMGRAKQSVANLVDQGIDLRTRPYPMPIAVSVDPQSRPLTFTDGNHRMIAQYLSHGTIEGVSIYPCDHERMDLWGARDGLIPVQARSTPV